MSNNLSEMLFTLIGKEICDMCKAPSDIYNCKLCNGFFYECEHSKHIDTLEHLVAMAARGIKHG